MQLSRDAVAGRRRSVCPLVGGTIATTTNFLSACNVRVCRVVVASRFDSLARVATLNSRSPVKGAHARTRTHCVAPPLGVGARDPGARTAHLPPYDSLSTATSETTADWLT